MSRGITVAEFIDALGGNISASKIAGVRKNAVSNWRTWGRIPPRHFAKYREAALARGLDVPEHLFFPCDGAVNAT